MAELIVTLKGRELNRVPIRKALVVIGRDDGNDIVIDNRGVSRQHALVRFEDGGFTVVDAGSSNGLFVNGSQTQAHRLRDGDEIGVGKFAIRFDATGGPRMNEITAEGDGAAPVRVARPMEATLALSPEEIQRLQASQRLPQPGAPMAQGGGAASHSSAGRPDAAIRPRFRHEDGGGGNGMTTVVAVIAIVALAGVAYFLLR